MNFKRYLEGFKFGLFLQLAVGPMAMLTFNTAKNEGFLVAFSLVLAIVLVDAFYITLACLGASRLLEKPAAKRVFRFAGSAVLILFGLNMVLGAFGVDFIPVLNVKPTSASIFIQGLVLTLSNPMTIIFWGSVLTAKIADNGYTRKEAGLFSFGVWTTSLLALTLFDLLGLFAGSFLPPAVSSALNVLVGLFLIGFGIRIFLKKS